MAFLGQPFSQSLPLATCEWARDPDHVHGGPRLDEHEVVDRIEDCLIVRRGCESENGSERNAEAVSDKGYFNLIRPISAQPFKLGEEPGVMKRQLQMLLDLWIQRKGLAATVVRSVHGDWLVYLRAIFNPDV
jgi:hypothetical protein